MVLDSCVQRMFQNVRLTHVLRTVNIRCTFCCVACCLLLWNCTEEHAQSCNLLVLVLYLPT